MGLRNWYRMNMYLGHQGAGDSIDIAVYVWVKDPFDALKKMKHMGGIKRSKIFDVIPLDTGECAELEQIILNDGLSLTKAKKKWYTSCEEYKWWKASPEN